MSNEANRMIDAGSGTAMMLPEEGIIPAMSSEAVPTSMDVNESAEAPSVLV